MSNKETEQYELAELAPELGECYRDLLNMLYDPTIKLIILQGGTSAGKTFNVLGALLTLMQLGVYPEYNEATGLWEYKPKQFKIVAVGVTLGSLKEGAEQDFGAWLSAFYPEGTSKSQNNKSRNRYLVGGSNIRFAAVPDTKRAKAIGKQDIVFMNEANEQTFAVFSALYIRTKGKMIIDFNPDTENWAHALIDAPDVAFRIWNYTHNIKNVAPNILEKIEEAKTTDAEWYKVYGLGFTGQIEGLVFKDVEYVEEMPAYVPRKLQKKDDAKGWTYGIDWGENKDPTAIVRCCVYQGKLYVEELYYKPTPSINAVSEALNIAGLGDPKKNPRVLGHDFYCDITPTAFINYMNDLGYFAIKAKKGQHSVTAGLSIIRTFGLCITKNSHNFKKEAQNYKYKTNRQTGVTMEGETEDKFNHLFDALRYAVSGNPEFRALLLSKNK
jgi:phage terminase large subunit